MSQNFEPNPPSRKDEDFPKTNTMPEGWVMDELMDVYNPYKPAADDTQPAERNSASSAPAATYVPDTGGANGKSHPADAPSAAPDNEHLFTYRLEPYPTPGEQRGMYL